MTNVLNPKIAIFFMALLPQFIDPAHQAFPVYQQILFLGFLMLVTSTIVNISVGIFAGRAGHLLQQNSTVSTWLNRLSAFIFFGLALRLVTSDR